MFKVTLRQQAVAVKLGILYKSYTKVIQSMRVVSA